MQLPHVHSNLGRAGTLFSPKLDETVNFVLRLLMNLARNNLSEQTETLFQLDLIDDGMQLADVKRTPAVELGFYVTERFFVLLLVTCLLLGECDCACFQSAAIFSTRLIFFLVGLSAE